MFDIYREFLAKSPVFGGKNESCWIQMAPAKAKERLLTEVGI
jgi:hypothetical protein